MLSDKQNLSCRRQTEPDVRLDQPRRRWAGVRRPRQRVGDGLVVTR